MNFRFYVWVNEFSSMGEWIYQLNGILLVMTNKKPVNKVFKDFIGGL